MREHEDGARKQVADSLDNRRPRDDGEAELDRELLARAQQRWGSAQAAQTSANDPMSLAAYIDRRLNEAETATVEAEFANDPQTRELWMRSHEAVGAYEAPPSLLVRRVTALAPDTLTSSVSFVQRFFNGLAVARPVDGLAWAAAAVLFVMICLGGFELGSYGYASARDTSAFASQTSALPFGPSSMF